jgi:hypothetical protein
MCWQGSACAMTTSMPSIPRQRSRFDRPKVEIGRLSQGSITNSSRLWAARNAASTFCGVLSRAKMNPRYLFPSGSGTTSCPGNGDRHVLDAGHAARILEAADLRSHPARGSGSS